MRSALCAALTFGGSALAYSSGSPVCDYPSESQMPGSRTGSGGFTLTPSTTNYVPGQAMTITVANSNSLMFKGLLLQAVQGSPGAPNTNVIGSFSALPASTQFVSSCNGTNGVITHSDATAKTSLAFTWTPPANATGPITFHLVAVVSRTEWYGKLSPITLTLTPSMGTGGGGGSTGGGGGSTGGGGGSTGGGGGSATGGGGGSMGGGG
ncbi:MAG: Reeler domain-containing protein, partial [Myxococcota bacterium]